VAADKPILHETEFASSPISEAEALVEALCVAGKSLPDSDPVQKIVWAAASFIHRNYEVLV
jgi:hypothetical protein